MQMVDTVEGLISSMELAAEMDNTENEAHKPAVHKIKMLASVQTAVGQTNLHKELLDAGFLGALKLWIEPLPDFSLPNVKVHQLFPFRHKCRQGLVPAGTEGSQLWISCCKTFPVLFSIKCALSTASYFPTLQGSVCPQ